MIVGVVRDVKHSTVRAPAAPTCYTLFTQAETAAGLTFYLRTWQAPETAANGVRAAVANIDPRLIVDGGLSTLNDRIDDDIMPERTVGLLAAVFGLLAALLAGIGLYGILAYSTAQRTREIGIRMALGARRGSVVGLILRETLLLAGIAVAATVPIARPRRARRAQPALRRLRSADPLVYAAGILAICLVAALAGFLPARRAAAVDPARALRTE